MPCTPRLSIFQDAFVVLGIVCCDGVDGVLILVEQIAHAVALVQGVELFLGHLLELFDKLDNVIVLALPVSLVLSVIFLSCSTVFFLLSRCALHSASLMALDPWGF